MFPLIVSNRKTIPDTMYSLSRVDTIKKKFFKFFSQQNFQKREPLPLISKYFPSSFVISAGPDLGDEYYNLAHSKENFMLIQPCARYWDVINSGDGRHLSFFEMSAINDFGYDGRKRIIKLFIDFFIGELHISVDNLCATYFEGGVVAKKYYQDEDHEFKKLMSEIYPAIPLYKVDATEGFVANSMEPFGGRKVEFYHIDYTMQCGLECGDSPEQCSCGKYLEICTTITYDYVVKHNKDKKILNLKPIDLKKNDVINVIGFGLERVASIVDNKRYNLETVEPFLSLLNSDKYEIKHDEFKYIDIIRALVFLLSSINDRLQGRKNKERRWCFNKYRNKELLEFIHQDKERAKNIIKIIIEHHKVDNYIFKDVDEILDMIINWR